MDREEWEIELESRKMLQETMITEMRKNKFIDDIKSGLGEDILKEPNKVHKIERKPSFFNKLKKMFFND